MGEGRGRGEAARAAGDDPPRKRDRFSARVQCQGRRFLSKAVAAPVALRHRVDSLGFAHGPAGAPGARPVQLRIFVSRESNHVSVSSEGPAPFLSVAYYPHREREAAVAPPRLEAGAEGSAAYFSCRQEFPATAPTDAVPDPPPSKAESSFALYGLVQGEWKVARAEPNVRLERTGLQPFRLDLTLFTPRDHRDNTEHARAEALRLAARPVAELKRISEEKWREFWMRSGVEFADRELEETWYLNQYRLACCLKEGKVAPAFSATGPAGGSARPGTAITT